MRDCDGSAVDPSESPQCPQRDAMVTAQSEQARWLFPRRRGRSMSSELRHGFSHLFKGHGIVDGYEGDVAAAHDLEARIVWVYLSSVIPSSGS